MKYFVYIVECADTTLYAGYTVDIEKRIKQHNTGKLGARYTKTRRPVQLVYSEVLHSKSEALKREYEIKQWPRHKKIELINKR